MGEIKKLFCDGCKAEYTPATYSQGQESGEVKHGIAVWTETGTQVEGSAGDLCPTCHGKALTWLKGKISVAATAFAIENPAVKTFTPPSL